MDSMNMHYPTSLPLVTLEGDTEFDYAAFFQEELGESSSSTSASAIDHAEAYDFPVPSTATVKSKAKSQQKLERRGHTKSRRGCFNCKRRRVKCQETRPACGHCVKSGLQCEYPAVPRVVHQPRHQIPLFSLQDMRFFQHFLTTCLPSHPLGNESIWSHEVLCLSQNYQYLMHAILGFAASDLMRKDRSLVTSAMTHRVKAINAIKKSLANVPKSRTFEEGNALLATCYALTFQSVCLEDGMAEFMTFCRGVLIVAIQMYCKGSKFIFNNLTNEDSKALLKPLMETIPPIRREWTDMAVASIAALEPLCKHQVEVEYRQLLKEWAETLYTNSFQAYLLLSKHYGWWIQMPQEGFAYLINPENQACLLLATHWIALKKIMATITDAEDRVNPSSHSQDGDPDIGMGRWLKYMNRQIDDEHREYNQWPMWVEKQLEGDLDFFRRP